MANIVIVGANQGIGYHMAKRLLELNHSVVVLDIDISNIRQLQPRYPETLLPIVVDARRLSDIENGVKQAAGRFGSIDIAIHNACRCTFMSEPDSDYDVYRDVMDVNFYGDPFEQNIPQAIAYYQMGVDAEDPIALNNLAIHYLNGDYLEKNVSLAMQYLRKAAEAGVPLAMTNLGNIYREGVDVEMDGKKAVSYYRLAAEKDDPRGLLYLGIC